MTDKLLLPVRIPELGPALGRLPDRPDPARPDPHATVRLRLVTRLLDAVGEARRRAAAEDREAALSALASQVWLDAWEEAVAGIAEQLLEDVERRLEAAARQARMRRRRRRRLAPTEAERRGIAARLGTTGAGLVAALDQLDARRAGARSATARDREAMDGWQAALLTCARRLEAAWDRLLDETRSERAVWDAEIRRAELWRPATWPAVAVAVPLLAVAVWIGLVLGGYVQSPAWFTRVWETVRP